MEKKKMPKWLKKTAKIAAVVVIVVSLLGAFFDLFRTKAKLQTEVAYTTSIEDALTMANQERSNAIADAEKEQAVLKEAINELVVELSNLTGMDLEGMTEEELATAYLSEMELRPTGVPFSVDVYRTTSEYGWRVNPVTGVSEFHAAGDLVPSGGDKLIYPSAEGVIIDLGLDPIFGKWILVEHNDNYRTFYAHLNTIFFLDEENRRTIGERVYPGTAMGVMGTTGQSTGPHLHYEVRKLVDGVWQRQNPAHYLGIRRRDK